MAGRNRGREGGKPTRPPRRGVLFGRPHFRYAKGREFFAGPYGETPCLFRFRSYLPRRCPGSWAESRWLVFAVIVVAIFINYCGIWFQAYMSSANVSLLSLIGMSFRRVNARTIVQGKIMAVQAGIAQDSHTGVTTRRLEAHYLAGGSVPNVIKAIIAAHRADIDLDFDRAAAIDLAGRDVLDAVQTSVYPKVIDCPDPKRSQRTTLSAIAKNGVELKVRARVTVRTNIEQLIGGATEETIIARVGEGIITAIGSSDSHLQVMENPDRISKAVLQRGLGRANGLRDRLDRHRRHRRGPEHRRPAPGRSGRGRHARRPGEGRGAAGVGHRARAGDEGPGRPQPRRSRVGRGRGAAGHGRRFPRGKSAGKMRECE